MGDLKIIYKDITDIKPYPHNPRNNETGIDIVATSIKEYGFKVPIIIDKNNEIIAGHTRILAAKQLGMTKIPCIIAEDLTDAQIKAFRIADNRAAESTTWDIGLLQIELQELQDMDFNIELTGFSEDELERMTTLNEPLDLEDETDNTQTTTTCYCPKCGFEFEI